MQRHIFLLTTSVDIIEFPMVFSCSSSLMRVAQFFICRASGHNMHKQHCCHCYLGNCSTVHIVSQKNNTMKCSSIFSLSFMLSTFYIDFHNSSVMNYVDERPIDILILFLLLYSLSFLALLRICCDVLTESHPSLKIDGNISLNYVAFYLCM